MQESLSRADLVQLVRTVFRPRADDRALALLVDLPDEHEPDRPQWAARRALAADWCAELGAARDALGLARVDFVAYPNVRRANADLPANGAVFAAGEAVSPSAAAVTRAWAPLTELLAERQILLAPTQFSATAPLKILARTLGFRAATMPGFSPAMLPALRLDYEEVSRRCTELAAWLDRAETALIRTRTVTGEHELALDLRHRSATASGGLIREPGQAGNLPSGETYIVPYEGERAGDPSRSRGELPLELEGEILLLRIEENRVVEVGGAGPVAAAERAAFASEPAYANVAELGLGILAQYGIEPIGELLLDEKLGLHVAFGRSDHFGGTVGPRQFRAADRVVHVDRVYIPQVQPAVQVLGVELVIPLMRGFSYVL